MKKQHWVGFAAVAAVVGVTVLRSQAYFQEPPPLETLPKELGKATELKEEDVVKVLAELGPELAKQIASGRTVTIQGLGTFRVVRLPESRNLVDGRPVVQAARNVVEFLPEAPLDAAANSPGARPAVEVPAFQYTPLPGQTPSTKVPYNRTRSSRVP